MRKLLHSLTLLLVFMFSFSCTLLQESTTDFSFTIPREVFAGNNSDPNTKYIVSCFLSGAVNESQTICLDESQKQATFTFGKIKIGENVNIKVRVYEYVKEQKAYVLMYGGRSSQNIKQRENIIYLDLNPAITITFENSENPQSTKTQRIIANEEEYLIPNEFVSNDNDLVFVGWESDNEGKVDYYDKVKVIFNEDTTLKTVYSYKQGYKITDKLSITKEGDSIQYDKTAEIVIIPKYSKATVHMTDDSSWNEYYDGVSSEYISGSETLKGVFIKGREVTLSAYAMSAFEVTQELYEAVMGSNPSSFTDNVASGETQGYRPVENVTWNDAVKFCNELTKLTMTDNDCVYTITDTGEKLEIEGVEISILDVTIDLSKKGYRLPTEAEWVFAARGGAPTKPEWKYAYAGVQSTRDKDKFLQSPFYDSALNDYAWHMFNLGSTPGTVIATTDEAYRTHEVGKKQANTLGLYDMSGNVYEWTNDEYAPITTKAVINPCCRDGNEYIIRGGSFAGEEDWGQLVLTCSVGFRSSITSLRNNALGFRLVRSLVD